MALHGSGYTWHDRDAWSQRDHRRYHLGEREREWAGFGDGDERVTSGAIVHMAETRGWTRPGPGMGRALGWAGSGTVAAGSDALGADAQPIEDADEVDWDPCRMPSDYLGTLFDDDDIVCLTMYSYNEGTDKEPQWKPRMATRHELPARSAVSFSGEHRDHGQGRW